MSSSPDDVRKSVSETYAKAVQSGTGQKGCCCPGAAPEGFAATLAGYPRELLAALPQDAIVNSFGCGNPIALAQVREGETVLDLGSGAGIDVLLAAKLVGPSGQVIGVDMTPEVIQRARDNAAAAGLDNVEIRHGLIEQLPVENGTVDLILSNCVINLSPEKPKVFAEIARVLKPGGRISISDIVAQEMPGWVKDLGLLYSACVAGAIPEEEYVAGLEAAGLTEVQVIDRLVYGAEELSSLLRSDLLDSGGCCGSASNLPPQVVDSICQELAGRVASIRVSAVRPLLSIESDEGSMARGVGGSRVGG